MKLAQINSITTALSVLTLSLATFACEPYGPGEEVAVEDPSQQPRPNPDEPHNTAEPDEPVQQGIPFDVTLPNAVLLVDRSGSMSQPGDCEGMDPCPSKWQQLLALGPYLSEVKYRARLGMGFFPSTVQTACGTDSNLVVPVSDDQNVDQMILNELQATRPGGSTPTTLALLDLANNSALNSGDRDNVVILLTDGQPNCRCGGAIGCERDAAVDAINQLKNRPNPIEVYVIGFGSSAASAHEALSAMSDAAETGPNISGEPSYYQANTVEQLIAFLYEVSVSTTPCDFVLDGAPAPDRLLVWLDENQVPPCEGECSSGYTYDTASGVVELRGETCATLRDGAEHNVWFDEHPE